jgi:scyllo-inositol 2-dehydrogenase (NADP+)
MSKPRRVLVVTGQPGPAARAICDQLEGLGMQVRQAEESSAIRRIEAGGIDCVVLTPSCHVSENDVLSLEDFVRAGGGLVAVGAPGSTSGHFNLLAGLLGCRVQLHTEPFAFKVQVADPNHPLAHRTSEFWIHDELSVMEKSLDSWAVLSAWYDGRAQPMACMRREGEGRVVMIALGRTAEAVAHPAWRGLVGRAVRLAAGEDWSSRTVRVGIIGYGGAFNMGKLHAEALSRARLHVTAVCDLDAKRAALAKVELGEHVRPFTDPARMLAESDVELCVIITPHNTHAALSLLCLEAGRHVVTEKPYTIGIDEATRVIETSRRVGRIATVFHNRRWDGDFLAMRRIVESGAIGDVFHVECAFGGYGEPRADWWRSSKAVSGGAFYDWGAHFVDWVLTLMPHPIESVSGNLHKRVWHQVSIEDHIDACIRFAGGRTAMIEQSSIAAIPKSRFRILGTHGGIEQRTAEPKDGIRVVSFRHGQRTESTVACLPSDWDAFYRNLADHLLLGEPLSVTPESARDVVAVLSLAEASAKQGGAPLPLPY